MGIRIVKTALAAIAAIYTAVYFGLEPPLGAGTDVAAVVSGVAGAAGLGVAGFGVAGAAAARARTCVTAPASDVYTETLCPDCRSASDAFLPSSVTEADSGTRNVRAPPAETVTTSFPADASLE